MIYADYARRKMHNVVKLGNAEGYPLVINNAEGKKLKDYTIEGNTEYGDNLFNYTEPAVGSSEADADGWFDITIDNTTGASAKKVWCTTKLNYRLKTNTQYQIFVEVAERTGGIDLRPYDALNSQFSTSDRINSPDIGVFKRTGKTKASFADCLYMMCSSVLCDSGKSGHIKFRIAVYETEKDVFLPYTKTSVGDMTENLFNYTEPLTNSIKADTDGWFDVTIDNSEETSKAKYVWCFTKINNRLKVNTPYCIFMEVAERTGDIGAYAVSTYSTDSSQFSKAVFLPSSGTRTTTVNTISDFSNSSNMLRTYCWSTAGKSGHIKFRIAVYETEKDYFEPYNKYKIPILVNGTNNETIYLNAPLADGESINYKADNLPDIVLNKGSNTITTDTAVKPKKISAKYYKTNWRNRVKEYGVRWNGTASTMCDRLGDAVGLVANAHHGTTDYVQNDFDSIYPWSDIKTCNIDADGNVLAYLGEPSFARDGTNGDVMVEIPKFYYKRIKTGIEEEIWICGTKLPGYELHPLFIDNGKEVSKVFHSAYNASSYIDETDNKVKLQSITGVQPRVRTTRAGFRTYARNKGAIWGIEDISCVNALQSLYLVEYANTHSQSALGNGASKLSFTANHKALEETTNGNTIIIASTYKNIYKLGQRIEIGTSLGANNKTATPRTITAITTDEETGQTTITFDGDPITIAVGNMMWNVAPLNGSCDGLNGKSGWIAGENNYTNTFADVNYRGIEGFHAKLFRFIDGVNIKDGVVYYANSIADYADGVYDGKYRAVGYSNAETSGYVSAFGYDEKAPWVMFPSAAVGKPSTFVPDYYYQNTGECLLLLGGAWSYGTGAGAFLFDCRNAFSSSYCFFGSHLLVKKP